MPVGAAVRLLAPHLKHKHTDPAVVCVDDAGQFAVSLISGHKGGADDLASVVAGAIGAIPVITSASHVLNTLAVDMLGEEFGWTIEANPTDVTRASAAVVNGESVGILQEAGESFSPSRSNFLMEHILMCESYAQLARFPLSAALIITDRVFDKSIFGAMSVITYRPKSLVVGMGCRRGLPVDDLERFLFETMEQHELSMHSVRCIATSEVKRDEQGLLELANRLSVPVKFYSGDELDSRPGPSGPSAAQEHLGVVGVSEPAALLASGSDTLIVPKVKSENATIAIARMEFE
jgi:cobalt-precorrin 5A hydrolase